MKKLIFKALVFNFLLILPATDLIADNDCIKYKPGTKEFVKKQIELTTNFENSNVVTEEIEKLETIYPDTSGVPKYERSGHQYTTFIVAMAAGLTPNRSYELTYFSQLPDDEKRFSATLAFFYLFDLDYRKQIMATLHSLHGGNHQAVVKRRQDLKNLIDDGINKDELKDFQVGLLIHAFADSYAHTKGPSNDLEAFSYTWGHLFHGHKPDIIAYKPDVYKEYTCQLFQALSAKTTCYPELASLHDMIDKLKASRNSELFEFEKYAFSEYGFDEVRYNYGRDNWYDSVSDDLIKLTIAEVEARVNNN